MQRSTNGRRAFGKYSDQFLRQIHDDLEELIQLLENKRDRAAFERVLKVLKKEINNVG